MYSDTLVAILAFNEQKKISEVLSEVTKKFSNVLLVDNNSSVFSSGWPAYNAEKLDKSSMNIAIQINGKLRGTIEVDLNTEKDKILSLCKDNTNVKLHLDKKEIIKEIYVPKKLVNFVIK